MPRCSRGCRASTGLGLRALRDLAHSVDHPVERCDICLVRVNRDGARGWSNPVNESFRAAVAGSLTPGLTWEPQRRRRPGEDTMAPSRLLGPRTLGTDGHWVTHKTGLSPPGHAHDPSRPHSGRAQELPSLFGVGTGNRKDVDIRYRRGSGYREVGADGCRLNAHDGARIGFALPGAFEREKRLQAPE